MQCPTTAPAVAEPPLTIVQTQRQRELLSLRWRRMVGHVTDLSVRRYSLDDTDPSQTSLVDDLESQLAMARHMLDDIEAALKQLESSSR